MRQPTSTTFIRLLTALVVAVLAPACALAGEQTAQPPAPASPPPQVTPLDTLDTAPTVVPTAAPAAAFTATPTTAPAAEFRPTVTAIKVALSTVAASDACPGAPPQRLQVGEAGAVCTSKDAVALRQQPLRSSEVLMRLPPGSEFDITGGPSCGENWSWWQVKVRDGTLGWIAEGGDASDPYFICPIR